MLVIIIFYKIEIWILVWKIKGNEWSKKYISRIMHKPKKDWANCMNIYIYIYIYIYIIDNIFIIICIFLIIKMLLYYIILLNKFFMF